MIRSFFRFAEPGNLTLPPPVHCLILREFPRSVLFSSPFASRESSFCSFLLFLLKSILRPFLFDEEQRDGILLLWRLSPTFGFRSACSLQTCVCALFFLEKGRSGFLFIVSHPPTVRFLVTEERFFPIKESLRCAGFPFCRLSFPSFSQ